VTVVRSLYITAILLALVGIALRVGRPPSPSLGRAATALPGPTPVPVREPQPHPVNAEAIVATDIFSRRRTAPSVRFTPVGAPVRTLSPAAPGSTLRLYGITRGPKGTVALIAGDPRVVGADLYRMGDPLAGGRIVAMTDSTVTLFRASGQLVLHLKPAESRGP